MAAADPRVSELSSEHRALLKVWLAEFCRSWHPDLLAERAQLLPPSGPVRVAALADMVKADLARQWAAGNKVGLEDYLAVYPELGAGETLDLVHAEYVARQGAGETVSLDEFARRFPEQAEGLRQLLAQVATVVTDAGAQQAVQPTQPTPAPTQAEVRATPGWGDLSGQFGRYHIVRKLGQGGMGAVYLALDTQLDRPIALKIPSFRAEDGPEVRERFLREARAAATLEHPHICPVHEVGEVNGMPYLVMTFIEGKPLSTVIEGGKPLPQRTAAAVVRKLALALQEAHGRGIIHRDLKPSNIMINQRREPVLMDFGLARRLKEDAPLTRPGAILGTPAYMPPEQVKGAVTTLGPAGDIYSLGVILYELVTGRPPFQGPVTAMLLQILTQTPPPPSTFRRDLDARLEKICLKAMARNPEERYRTMGEMAAALTDYLRATLQPGGGTPQGDDLLVLVPTDSAGGNPGGRAPSPPPAVAVLRPLPETSPVQAAVPPPVIARAMPVKPARPAPPVAVRVVSPGERAEGGSGCVWRMIKIFAPVMLLIAGVAAIGAGVYYFKFSSTAYYKEGQRLAKRGEYEAAISQYSLAIRRDSKMTAAYQARAELYFRRGEYDLAVNDCTRVLQLEPMSARAYAFRGGAYNRLGEFTKAIEDCNEALRLDHFLAIAFTFRGDVYGNMADHEKALEDLNRAIELDAEEPLAYAYRSDVYGDLSRYDEAIDDCNKALNLDSNLGLAYAYRGAFLTRKGRFNEADADFDKAIQLAPNEAEVYNSRGVARSSRGDRDLALADFTRAIEIAPGFSEFYSNRANVRLSRREYDLALQDATEGIRRCPQSAAAHLVRARTRYHKKDYTEAAADATEAIRLNGRYADAYHLRGLVYRAQGKSRDAIVEFTRSIEVEPRSDNSYAERGRVYLQDVSQYDLALADFDQAIKLAGHHAPHHFHRGLTHMQLHKYREAIGDFEEAIRHEPENGTYWYHVSVAHEKIGNLSKAREYYDRAVQLDPSLRDLHKRP
jgi:tetratricopeptide (TPR) repeat protein/predicted Ser/Thr protein kinase